MSTARDLNDLSRVAAQSAWVRRLAVALAHDVHAGEDIAQDALLAAARGHGIADLRAWLAGTVRNLARLRRRGDERRVGRERAAARAESVDDPALALERLELQEALLGAVRELAEPYRTTVLLRWFEGLEPEEIARRTDTPVRTVHTRLQRALAQLRETLDRRSQGDRTRWLAAWLPLLPKSTSVWTWASLMSIQAKLTVVALTAASVLTIWYLCGIPESTTALPAGAADSTVASAESRTTGREALESSAPATEPRTNALAEEEAQTAPPAASGPRTIAGIVLDVLGAKLARVAIVFRPHDGNLPVVRTSSDDVGCFRMEVPRDAGRLEPEAKEWSLVYQIQVEPPDPAAGYFVVLGKPRPIFGHVVDAAGRPVGEAAVWFGPRVGRQTTFFDALDDPLRRALGVDMGTADLMGWQATTSATGAFSFTGISGVPGYRLSASKAGYGRASVNVPEEGQAATIVLTPESGTHGSRLSGQVVDPAGQGVARASVRLGSQVERTNDWGAFSIAIDPRAPGARMIALHQDWSPVLQPCLSASPSDPGAWPEPLILKFAEPSPALEGVVLDGSGRPVRDIEVRALDPQSWDECLGLLGEAPVRDGNRSDSALGDGRVNTNENGRFRLRGLVSRSYHLRAADRRTLRIGLSEAIPAGTLDARIVLEIAPQPCTITGRVVDLRDRPIAGANVAARRSVPAVGSNSTEPLDSQSVTTDAQGRFQLVEVSCEATALIVQPETATPKRLVPLERGAAWDALVVKVGRTARVRVELQTQDLEADSVAFLDAHGKPLDVGAKRSRSGWISSSSMPIVEGKTEVLVVSEEAATLVLRKNGNEVGRVPVRLDPTETNVVRP